MEGKAVAILEVSQKQAFIFSSNKLKDNVANSAIIAWITSSEYFEEVCSRELFCKEKNLIYAGGGHTVLQFCNKDAAVDFVKKVTLQVKVDYPEVELFAKVLECGEEIKLHDLKELSKQLEVKKSERRAAFHQGSFGIEAVDSVTLNPEVVSINGKQKKKEMPEEEKKIERELGPEGDYIPAGKFENLGGSREESNFIAVVHIDGNGMGKRVANLRESLEQEEAEKGWGDVSGKLKEFSESIDQNFKDSYHDMVKDVQKRLESDKLSDLNLKEHCFPVRRIITAGDDICFVTEGRIGIECANLFIKHLNTKENSVDHKGYAACAGVAIVHQKYPFYRAYELAEMLCGNAKSYIATTGDADSGQEVSAIDWHIEFGELEDTIDEIRKDYEAEDGSRMELRPYIVSAPESFYEKDPARDYRKFQKLMKAMMGEGISFARGKMKNLRAYMHQGIEQTQYYLDNSGIGELGLLGNVGIYEKADLEKMFSGSGQNRKCYEKASDGKQHSLFYDAIELLDTYIALEEVGEETYED